jgi:hypothetical protein
MLFLRLKTAAAKILMIKYNFQTHVHNTKPQNEVSMEASGSSNRRLLHVKEKENEARE